MNKLQAAARTSEFWVGLAGAIGAVLANYGVIDKATYDQFVAPVIVYVAARITSKLAKS